MDAETSNILVTFIILLPFALYILESQVPIVL